MTNKRSSKIEHVVDLCIKEELNKKVVDIYHYHLESLVVKQNVK